MNATWIAFLRIAVGIFFLGQGINKIEWLTSSEFLKTNLDRYALNAHPAAQWYQERVAKPGVEIWARAIPMGEMLIGIALILGVLTRTTLSIATLLVVNFHITNGKFFSLTFFSDPYALLLLACLLALSFSKAHGTWALTQKW